MEPLPDLATLSDADLKELIDELDEGGERGLVPAPAPAREDRHPARRARRAAPEDGGKSVLERGRRRPARPRSSPARPPRPPRRSLSHVYCPECGFQNPEAANYCSRCGALLVTEGESDEPTMTFTPEESPRRPRRPSSRSSGSRGRRSSSAPAAAARASTSSLERRARRRSAARRTATSSSTTSPSRAGTPSLVRRATAFSIEDHGSLNGTFLNRRRIESGRARGRRRAPDRQVPADLPRAMSTAAQTPDARRPAHDRRGLPRACRTSSRTSRSRRSATSRTRACSRRSGRAGGYRLFSEDDVERLETILRLQRDEFLPLRVIRQELASPARAERASAARPAGLGEHERGARPRRALRARRHRPASSRASSRSTACSQPRGERRREALPGRRRRDRGRLRAARALRDRAAPPAHVPHRGRPRGRPARAARRAGAALAQPRAPRGGPRATCRRSPSSPRSSRSSSSGAPCGRSPAH